MGKPRSHKWTDDMDNDEASNEADYIHIEELRKTLMLLQENDARRKEWEQRIENRLAAMETGAKVGLLKQYPVQFFAILTGTVLSLLATLGYNLTAEQTDIVGNLITLVAPVLLTWIGAGKIPQEAVTPIANPNLPESPFHE